MGFKRSWVQIPPARVFTSRPCFTCATGVRRARRRYHSNYQFLQTPAGQKGIDQLRQVITVATLKNRGGGNGYIMQPCAEHREVFGLQRHLHDRIALVGVKAGGNELKIRFEREKSFQRVFSCLDMNTARCRGADWVVVDVGERIYAGSGIRRKLMDRGEGDSRV